MGQATKLIIIVLFLLFTCNLQAVGYVADYISKYLEINQGGLNPSDPNFEVIPTDNIAFSIGFSKSETYGNRLLFSFGKNMSSESRGMLRYYRFETGDLEYIVGLDYIKKLFWNSKHQYGAKGHFSANYFELIDDNTLQLVSANILFGKTLKKNYIFFGMRTPVLLLYTQDKDDLSGDIKTSRSYIGMTYQLKPSLGLYADYSRKTISLGVTVSTIVIRYLLDDGKMDIGHPFMYY